MPDTKRKAAAGALGAVAVVAAHLGGLTHAAMVPLVGLLHQGTHYIPAEVRTLARSNALTEDGLMIQIWRTAAAIGQTDDEVVAGLMAAWDSTTVTSFRGLRARYHFFEVTDEELGKAVQGAACSVADTLLAGRFPDPSDISSEIVLELGLKTVGEALNLASQVIEIVEDSPTEPVGTTRGRVQLLARCIEAGQTG